MKTLFFLVLPLVLLAQQARYWPDTIVMKGGKVFPCLVDELQQSAVILTYSLRAERLNLGLTGVEKIMLAEHGTVFQADSGLRGGFSTGTYRNLLPGAGKS